MRLVAFTIVVLWFTASTAWAQDGGTDAGLTSVSQEQPAASAPTVAAQAAHDPSSLPPCLAPTVLPQPSCTCSEPPATTPWLRAARIGLEVVMGVGLGAVPEVGGAYIGILVDVMGGREAGVGMDIGTAIGASLGVGSAVWLAGYLLGGDGSFGWSVLGSTVGTGLAAGVLAIKSTSSSLVVAAALPVIGAITGYEFSSHPRRPSKPDAASSGITVTPTIGPTSVGLAGNF